MRYHFRTLFWFAAIVVIIYLLGVFGTKAILVLFVIVGLLLLWGIAWLIGDSLDWP